MKNPRPFAPKISRTAARSEPERLALVVRGGQLVTPTGVVRADLAVLRGKIVRIAPEIADEADATLDASGRFVFPGVIDAHVHLGRARDRLGGARGGRRHVFL
jgi:imidazolonepropionase-like amidohydrolase